jgi:hypothetical protein
VPSSKLASKLPSALGLAWFCLAWLGCAAPAFAQATSEGRARARVVVAAPSDASPLLREALVRAQGELAAVGLDARLQLVDVATGESSPRLARDVYGLLAFEERAATLTIHAWAPRADQPIVATVKLGEPGVNAEVIAVRAVETLRAAMLEFAQTARGDVPAVVRGFTRFEPEPERAPPPAAPRWRSLRLAPPLAFWAGPAVSLHAGGSPDLGAQFGVLVGPSFGFAAAAFESTLGNLRLQAAHGSAEVRRQAVWAQLGARFRPARAWEIATRAGVGYAAFSITGSGDAGYRGKQATHGSLAFMLAISGTYWATRSFGLYTSVGGRVATDAPSIVIAEQPVITLDRPSFVISLGANVGLF